MLHSIYSSLSLFIALQTSAAVLIQQCMHKYTYQQQYSYSGLNFVKQQKFFLSSALQLHVRKETHQERKPQNKLPKQDILQSRVHVLKTSQEHLRNIPYLNKTEENSYERGLIRVPFTSFNQSAKLKQITLSLLMEKYNKIISEKC